MLRVMNGGPETGDWQPVTFLFPADILLSLPIIYFVPIKTPNMTTQYMAPATGNTAIAYLMKNYANYNLWANTTLVRWLKSKPAAELEQEVASSFPSIKLTLLHIW